MIPEKRLTFARDLCYNGFIIHNTGIIMNKVYIVEGQDRCGKSTVVDLLRRNIKNPKIIVIHSAKPPKDVDLEEWTLAHYYNLNKTVYFLVQEGYDVILDRSYLGETVYGPLYRSVSIPLKTLELSNAIKQELIVLVDDASSIASRSDGLSMSDDIAMLEAERKAFRDSFFASSVANKELIDWEYESFSKSKLEAFVKGMIIRA